MPPTGFAPRVGLAYRLGPTWVIRTGYGLNIDPYSLARPWRTNYPILLAMSLPSANSFAYLSRTEDGIPPVPIANASTGHVPNKHEVIAPVGLASLVKIPAPKNSQLTLSIGDFKGSANVVSNGENAACGCVR